MKIISLLLLLFLMSCNQNDDILKSELGTKDLTISLLKVTPSRAVIAPNGQASFTGVGGNPPYIFSVLSGEGSVDADGVYTASASAGSSTVQVTDRGGSKAFALVTVGSSLQISPSSRVLGVDETITFTGSGGVAPYTYSIASGSGSISAAGVYTAPATPGNASARITDQNGQTATASIVIVDALTVTPSAATVETNSVTNLSAVGGTPPYTYQVYAGPGSIDGSGNFTAPASAGSSVARVIDATNYYKEVVIETKQGPSASAVKTKLPPNWTTTVSSSTGTAPFAYSLINGAGNVDSATGVYTAPAQASSAVIRVTDAHGFSDDIVIDTFNPKKISAGETHICSTQLLSDNATSETKCWGRNRTGVSDPGKVRIGDEPGEMGANTPLAQVGTDSTPAAIYSSPTNHSCILFANNKAKCFGYNNYGQLGMGNTVTYGHVTYRAGDNLNYIYINFPISSTAPIENRIALGPNHSCLLTDSGSGLCFGYGANGQLGNGSGAYACNSTNNCGPFLPELELGAGRSIKKFALGSNSTCALMAPENQVKCWGHNHYGFMGREVNTTQFRIKPKDAVFVDLGAHTVRDISAGYHHMCALLDDYSVKCWGRGSYGATGHGDGNHYGDAAGEMGVGLPYTDLGSVSFPIKIFSGPYNNCAIFNNGGLKCWGRNDDGQLGLENGNYWGDQPNEMGDNLAFVDLGNGRTTTHVSMTELTTCATLDNGAVKCWGNNQHGQLGQGHANQIGRAANQMGDDLPEIDLNGTALHTASTTYGNCALMSDSKVKCWGHDNTGQLLIGSQGYGDEPGELISAMAPLDLGTSFIAGNIFSNFQQNCALGQAGQVKCWGDNNQGKLGVGNSNSRGQLLSDMGDNLTVADLGSGASATKIAMGYHHTCALLDNGDVKCWGDGNYGGTGYNSLADRADNSNEMGDNLPIVPLGQPAKDISAGNAHTCAILNDDSLKCWGRNWVGKLGLEDGTNRAYDATWGLNTYGTTNLGTGRTLKQISAGHEHNCAILDNDKVKCWGYNYYGQLGQETFNIHRGDNAGEMGDGLAYTELGAGVHAIKLASGYYHTCALLSNHKVKCWGRNEQAQLGQGSNDPRVGDSAGEMGDNLPYSLTRPDEKIIDIFAGAYNTCVLNDQNEVYCWGSNWYGSLGVQHPYEIGKDPLFMGPKLSPVN